MTTPTVIGLDLSSTRTGICLPDGTTEHIDAKGTLYERARQMVDGLRPWMFPPVDLVVVEAIGTRHVQTAIALAYVHAYVDRMLEWQRVVKVSPALLKKYATGKGNADKHAMTMAAIRNGWTSDDSTDDEADAWWLWALGMHLLRHPVVADVTTYRADVVASMLRVVGE